MIIALPVIMVMIVMINKHFFKHCYTTPRVYIDWQYSNSMYIDSRDMGKSKTVYEEKDIPG